MTALDAALEKLAATAPEFGGGLSNHGPMVAEVLWRRGHESDLEAWINGYCERLEPAPDPADPVTDESMLDALGVADAYPAWLARFERAIAAAGPMDVLADWVPRLMPGVLGGAFHGVIRTSHAARAIADADTEPRRAELAAGLAYWASQWVAPPVDPAWTGTSGPARALPLLPAMPADQRGGWLILDRAAGSGDVAGFEEAVDTAGPVGDPLAGLVDLARVAVGATAAARVEAPIPFIHAVTGPMAVADLLAVTPEVSTVVADDALRWTWAAVAAVATAYLPLEPAPIPESSPAGVTDVIDDALDCGDEHAIKHADAALRADPSPLTAAIAQAITARLRA